LVFPNHAGFQYPKNLVKGPLNASLLNSRINPFANT